MLLKFLKATTSSLKTPNKTTREPRFKVLGMLGSQVVILIYIPREERIRIISMRKTDSDESNEYFETFGYELGET
jgi:uncharacterized DUF497 family protein